VVDVESVLAITFLFGGGSLVGISYSPIGKAIADRVRHGKSPLPAAEPDAAVYEELDHLRAELGEVQERLDFAERLLAKPGAAAGNGGPSGS
jgi:hypothetical protein